MRLVSDKGWDLYIKDIILSKMNLNLSFLSILGGTFDPLLKNSSENQTVSIHQILKLLQLVR